MDTNYKSVSKFHVFHDSTNFYGSTGNARGHPRYRRAGLDVIPCGFMACDAQRVICRIDECRGWSAGLALAPVMFRAQLNEQDLPLSLTVVGIAPEKLSAWAGADAECLTVTALPAITTYGEPEGTC